MLHINHPRVIATARFLGITELQALRHEQMRDRIRAKMRPTIYAIRL